MILGRRRDTPGPVPVPQRWRQVFESGEVVLHSFTPAELDAVTLRPEPAPPESAPPEPAPPGRGLPYLVRHAPPGDAPPADLVARLEASGFVRPWPPAPPEGQMPVEFAGLVASDNGAPPREVALASDLGLITYMRGRPLFVAEVYRAPDPARPERAPGAWQLAARAFVPYEMPGCLIERPPGPDGGQPPHVILREDRAAAAMLAWLGGDVTAYLKLRQARAAGQPAEPGHPGGPAGPVATATVAAGFSQLAQLCLVLPAGPAVVLRALAAGTSAAGTSAAGTSAAGHWLLTGEQLELAEPVTLAQLGDRLDDMLATASRPGAAASPDTSNAG